LGQGENSGWRGKGKERPSSLRGLKNGGDMMGRWRKWGGDGGAAVLKRNRSGGHKVWREGRGKKKGQTLTKRKPGRRDHSKEKVI